MTPEARPNFPLVGIEVSLEFVSAFVAGALLICIFAWRRFSEPVYDVGADAFPNFRDLTIWSLKDGYSLRRAYMIYCLALVFIYATLAFFGRVIFQLASQFQVAGLQVNVGTVAFDSWQWPLFLALGIAGFAPLINPLVPVESWLRRFSHEVVGIPTRLQEKCLRLKTLIDGDASIPAEVGDPAAWWERQLGPKLASMLMLRRNLGVVVAWSNAEHLEWSDPEIRRKLNAYERAARDSAEAALAEFDYLTRNDPELERDLAGHPERLKDFEARLWTATEMIERARDRLAIVMAIYCENGAVFQNMPDCRLKQAIEKNFVDREELPATGLPLYAFIVIFIVYFVAISSQWHSLISAVPLTHSTIAVSAALETLKVFTVVWLPLVVVTTFSTVVLGPRPRVTPGGRHEVLWGTIPGAVGVFVVALAALALVSILFAALPTDSLERMRQSLFGTGPFSGVLQSFLKLSPIAIICFVFVNAVRKPEEEPKRWIVFLLAIGAAASSLAYTILMENISYSAFPCERDLGAGVVDIWTHNVVFPVRFFEDGFKRESLQACFSFYGVTNITVITLASFFSVFGLVRIPMHSGEAPASPDRTARGSARAGAAALAVFALLPTLGVAQQLEPAAAPKPVTLGFRTDVQPFSFRAAGMQGGGVATGEGPRAGQPYVGYVAELCSQIFSNSAAYEVVQVPVTAENRFKMMRRPGAASQGAEDALRVDVLCDATTLRLDDPDRTNAGVFSPIIFVSGVSYVTRSVRRFGVDVELGFARGTTASGVVEEACELDFLQLGAGKGAAPECKPPESIDEEVDCRPIGKQQPWRETPSLAELNEKKTPSYVMCAMRTHDELIEWFCNDNGRDKAYFGDREIILAKLTDWRARGRSCVGVRDPVQSFTYEPYALLISKNDPELIAFVQQRVYELFSHRSGIEALFAKWFPGQNMSPALAWLYVLNGVMQEERLLSGPKDYRAPDAAAVAAAE